ncbi:cytochrome P450 [Mycena sp. CBHHK59/15]|nr:cytochrome P450 [Mycena sp. CBHHK59/15]
MVDSLTVLDVAFAILGAFILKTFLKPPQRTPLPPGPRPILGAFALPSGSDKEWITYGKWAETWGDITSVTVFGQPLIAVNSVQVAREMLDKKSSIYSDRPVLQMCGELVGWKKSLGLLQYGTSQFRRTRRYFHQSVGTPTNVARFHPIQAKETCKFLQHLLESPGNFLSHIRQSANTTLLRIAYGYIVESDEDPLIRMVDTAMAEFSESSAPGEYLVDVLPILKYIPSWMPGAGFKRKAKLWATHLTEVTEKPFKFVQDQMAQGSARDSFTSILLGAGPSGTEISDVKWAAGAVYAAGVDTTVSVISLFFLLMTLHPEIQAKAQAEIDRVVGSHRLPTHADRASLPYVDALCKETFRYHPVAPMAVPHRAMEDDIHDGYFIPKGSIILPNIWNMAHDPAVYKDPMTFNPSRFITSDGHIAEPDPRDIIFGFGRRYFPGRLMGDASVFIACAMTLAAFTISKTVKDGQVTEPVMDFLPGTVSRAAPFLCSITPRSPEAAALISAQSHV